MFKKTAIAALVLGFSGAASAAMYAPAAAPACSAGNVSVPCEKSAWDLGVQALYLKAENNDQQDAGNDFNADWGWGFRLEGSYHFGTGNDATLNWLYFDKTTGTSGSNGYFKPKYNIVNFEMGQKADFGEAVDMRFHGGLQYASLKQDIRTGGLNASTKISGLGVRGGIDTAYDFGNGFAVTSSGAMAVLVAKDKVNTTGLNVSNNKVVTGLEAKVGARYTHAMTQGDLSFEGGYQMANYNTSNFAGDVGLHGIYLGLKWVGNV